MALTESSHSKLEKSYDVTFRTVHTTQASPNRPQPNRTPQCPPRCECRCHYPSIARLIPEWLIPYIGEVSVSKRLLHPRLLTMESLQHSHLPWRLVQSDNTPVAYPVQTSEPMFAFLGRSPHSFFYWSPKDRFLGFADHVCYQSRELARCTRLICDRESVNMGLHQV